MFRSRIEGSRVLDFLIYKENRDSMALLFWNSTSQNNKLNIKKPRTKTGPTIATVNSGHWGVPGFIWCNLTRTRKKQFTSAYIVYLYKNLSTTSQKFARLPADLSAKDSAQAETLAQAGIFAIFRFFV